MSYNWTYALCGYVCLHDIADGGYAQSIVPKTPRTRAQDETHACVCVDYEQGASMPGEEGVLRERREY